MDKARRAMPAQQVLTCAIMNCACGWCIMSAVAAAARCCSSSSADMPPPPPPRACDVWRSSSWCAWLAAAAAAPLALLLCVLEGRTSCGAPALLLPVELGGFATDKKHTPTLHQRSKNSVRHQAMLECRGTVSSRIKHAVSSKNV